MSVAPIRWRPLGARDLEAGVAWLTNALASWRQAWFAAPAVNVEAVTLLDAGATFSLPSGSPSWSIGPDLWLIAEPRPFARLVNVALDLPKTFALDVESAPPLLATIEQRLIGELLDAIGGALLPAQPTGAHVRTDDGAAPPHLPYGGARYRLVSAGGETLLSLVCGAPTLWTCLPLARMHEHSTGVDDPTPRNVAIEDCRITVCAMLGKCELTVPQLASLALGDIVGLDHALTEPVALLLTQPDGGRPIPVAAGMPGQHAGKLSIQLTSIARPDTP